MKKIIAAAVFLGLFACEPQQGKKVNDAPSQVSERSVENSNMHEIVAEEVLQANNYTYVKATENGKEIWMAIMKSDIEVGKKYYYDEAMEMKDFTSKDLDRTFESIYFLQGLYDQPSAFTKAGVKAPDDAMHGQKTEPEKKDINIPAEAGVKSIEVLYKNKNELASRKVTVKGIVTKYNPKIMQKNWVHIQDGTGTDDAFDLTITTQDEVKVGDVVKFEGTVVIDKDFGHGYEYDLLIEDAVLLDKKPEVKVN